MSTFRIKRSNYAVQPSLPAHYFTLGICEVLRLHDMRRPDDPLPPSLLNRPNPSAAKAAAGGGVGPVTPLEQQQQQELQQVYGATDVGGVTDGGEQRWVRDVKAVFGICMIGSSCCLSLSVSLSRGSPVVPGMSVLAQQAESVGGGGGGGDAAACQLMVVGVQEWTSSGTSLLSVTLMTVMTTHHLPIVQSSIRI
eukprot:1149970-Pelagomonas_calceolata.AAC.2